MCSASGAASSASKNLNGYVLNIQKLQSPVTDSSTPLTQKIFIYYRITPQNSSHIVSEYYGLFLDVTQTVSDNNIILTPVTVYNGVTGLPQPITNPSSVLNQFSLMGKVAR